MTASRFVTLRRLHEGVFRNGVLAWPGVRIEEAAEKLADEGYRLVTVDQWEWVFEREETRAIQSTQQSEGAARPGRGGSRGKGSAPGG